MRLRGRRSPEEPPTADALLAYLHGRPRDPDPVRAATDAGVIEGAEAARVRLRPHPDEQPRQLTGQLTGELLRRLVDQGRPLDNETVRIATCYAVPLGDDWAQELLDDPATNLRTLHIALMTYLEQKLGRPAEVSLESQLVSWLATQLQARPSDSAGKILGRDRARRLARHFPDLPPERVDET